jgi:hypothetical protein
MIKLMSEREADEFAKYGEVQTWSDDDKVGEVPISYLAECLKTTPQTYLEDTAPEDNGKECPEDFVGSKIARKFGTSGIYLGEVLRIEYNSEDENKVISDINFILNPRPNLIHVIGRANLSRAIQRWRSRRHGPGGTSIRHGFLHQATR